MTQLLGLLIALGLCIPSAAEDLKGVAVEAPGAPEWTGGVGRQWALVIGIDKYRFHTPLSNCVHDSRSLAALLRDKYGFERIIELYDESATQQAIIDSLRDLASNLTEENSLLIYFSGHGTKDDLTGDAFWVPVEGKSEVDFIASDRIQRYVRAMKARHIWVVCDSCFSGRLFAEKGVTVEPAEGELDRYVTEALKKKSRLVLASGGDEPVTAEGFEGHSVFAHYFLKALENPPRGWTDSSQVFNQVKVDIARNASQSPQMGAIFETDHRGGEFILVPRRLPEGELKGILLDTATQAPLRGARVGPIGTDRAGEADIQGAFSLKLVVGTYPGLRIQAPNLPPSEVRGEIKIVEGQVLDLGNVLVSPPLPALPPPPPLIEEPPAPETTTAGIPLPSGERIELVELPGSPIRIGKYEITQSEWGSVVAGLPVSKHDLPLDPSKIKGARYPVENVSLEDCREFCRRLSSHFGKEVRLPTEEEWEAACRAGGSGLYVWGESPEEAAAYANFGGGDHGGTFEVGSFKPNQLGIHDLAGNVGEWCEPGSRKELVYRGGTWKDRLESLRCDWRVVVTPKTPPSGYVGFRIVCAR